MTHFIVSRNEAARDTDRSVENPATHLSVRMGQMSLLQYGLTVEPAPGVLETFDPNRLVLLVLNNRNHVRYDLFGKEVEDAGENSPADDRVVLIGPWRTPGDVPRELSPVHLFQYQRAGDTGRAPRKWTRSGCIHDDGKPPTAWNDALVFDDARKEGRYAYEYRALGAAKEIDDYRFHLNPPEGENYFAYEWIAPATMPRAMLDGQPLIGAMTQGGGGSQQSGGAEPYPPK